MRWTSVLLLLVMPPLLASADRPAVILRIEGAVAKPCGFSSAELREQFKGDLRQLKFKIKDRETAYTALPLAKLLEAAAPRVDASIKNHRLAFSFLFLAKDGYLMQMSWGELLPEYGAREVYVAIGGDSPAAEGLPRLLVVGDQHFGRCIHDLQAIRVIDGLKLANAKE